MHHEKIRLLTHWALCPCRQPCLTCDARCRPRKKKVDQWLGPCRVRWHGEAAMWTARLDSAEWGQTPRSLELPSKQCRGETAKLGLDFPRIWTYVLLATSATRHTLVLMSIQLTLRCTLQPQRWERIEGGRVLWNTGRQMERATVRCVGEHQRAERLLETMHDVCYNSRIQKRGHARRPPYQQQRSGMTLVTLQQFGMALMTLPVISLRHL